MDIAKKKLLEMYTSMLTIRRFEERAAALLFAGELPGGTHPYIGQEAVAVGVCSNLRLDDRITSTHRGHGHIIAKGADIKLMMAELFGKKTGSCRGRGGSMHICDFSIGVLGACGIVGGGLPIATGSGLAAKMQKTDQVTVCFFGEGASNEGNFHESVNMASIWELPVIYVCENNVYAITTRASSSISVENIADRAIAYSIPGVTVDGQDVMAVYKATNKAVERARRGEGPSLIECKTYRYFGHTMGEDNLLGDKRYRTVDEVEEWKNRDPLTNFQTKLLEMGEMTTEEVTEIEERIKSQLTEAVTFARQSPYPDPDELLKEAFV